MIHKKKGRLITEKESVRLSEMLDRNDLHCLNF